jgi:hypothetical protein
MYFIPRLWLSLILGVQVLEILDWPFLRPHGRHNYSDYVVLCDTSGDHSSAWW